MEPAFETAPRATASSRSSGRRSPSGVHCPPDVMADQSMTAAKKHSVECAVYRDGSHVVAACLDLGLVVQRANAEEALQELFALIQSYVNDAHGEGLSWEQTLRPLPRRKRQEIYLKVGLGMLRQWLATLINHTFDHSAVHYCSYRVPAAA